jgi:nickel-dependent lactate racemase
MMFFQRGSETASLTSDDLKEGVAAALEAAGNPGSVLAVPPDITRYYSRAGEITGIVHEQCGDALKAVLPALGTHSPMTDEQIAHMFPGVPRELFHDHDWREGIRTLGEVPGSFMSEVSEGKLDYSWPAQVDVLLAEGGYDAILSIGQVVPHEVVGMANFNKNIFIGTGGADGINKSHFLGAVYGMERIMGRADTPVRKVLNYASREFTAELNIIYIMTVIGTDESGELVIRGLFCGDDEECFEAASALSLKVNFTMLEKPLDKVVVYLEPDEYKSTWLGNKSIYRTRMAIADGGELIVLAPGVKEFGEDPEIDRLIRKYGYSGTPFVLDAVEKHDDLKANLSAAAHLIHGSTEGRFSVTYCPGNLTKAEVEGANFKYADLSEMTEKYNPDVLKDGYNSVDGSEIFYISNPGLGLWAHKDRF